MLVISKDAFRPHMSTASDALAKVLLDKFPEVKRQAAETVRVFCSKMPEQIGLNARQIIKSLAKNTEHNHSKIRKVSVEVVCCSPKALTDILTVQHGGECFKDCETEIKKLLTDKSSDVRKEVYNLLGTCLKRFSYPDLKTFEVKLVKHLLSGLSEENVDTRQLVSKLLEQCGESRKQLEDELKTYSA